MSRQGALFHEKVHIIAHLDFYVGLIVPPMSSDVLKKTKKKKTRQNQSQLFAQLILRLRIVQTG